MQADVGAVNHADIETEAITPEYDNTIKTQLSQQWPLTDKWLQEVNITLAWLDNQLSD